MKNEEKEGAKVYEEAHGENGNGKGKKSEEAASVRGECTEAFAACGVVYICLCVCVCVWSSLPSSR